MGEAVYEVVRQGRFPRMRLRAILPLEHLYRALSA